ncbi:MAG: NAD(P)H-binding protein [Verrucomicrobiota bacterium]|jgi:NADH dehydrogenase
MKIAITGGLGFIGGRLAESLAAAGNEIVLVTRPAGKKRAAAPPPGARVEAVGLEDEAKLALAFAGCEAVAHCAGINREIGDQTYDKVHLAGSKNVVGAARKAGVRKIVFTSFLRARLGCGSRYHESKWAAEEIIRGSGLDHTILKPGVTYGRGDHMLDHLSRAFHTFPVFALVGMKDQLIRPMAVEDLVRVLIAALVDGRMSRQTVAVLGPEEMTLRQAVGRVAGVVGKRPVMVRLPLFFHYALAWALERAMRTPLVSLAQVRILSEGIVEPLPPCEWAPDDLSPRLPFTEEQIRRGLPAPGAFSFSDLRCHALRGS